MTAKTNADLGARRETAIPRAMANASQTYVHRARNAELWDVEGRRYIDFAGGIAVVNTGHCHPVVMERVREQASRFTHTCFTVLPYEPYVALAERLNAVVPIPGAKKTVLFSTGVEAVENAIKIARYATGRSAVISFGGAFHGRTMMALAMTGKMTPYKAGFGPFPADVFHAPFPSAFHGITEADSLGAIEALFRADVEPRRVAAIIVEPVQGEGGFYPAPASFLQRLRQLCDAHGILLVADEIQTGFGRTGRMFALEHSGVAADIIAMAKSLAGGLPLSAVTGRADIMDAVPPGGLGSTYAGNPLACAAALGVLDVIAAEQLCDRAAVLGARLQTHLRALALPQVGEIRGVGAMVALELAYDGDPKRPAPELAKAAVDSALREGLILLSCGVHSNVLRFLFPLTIEDTVFEEGLQVLARVLRNVVMPPMHERADLAPAL